MGSPPVSALRQGDYQPSVVVGEKPKDEAQRKKPVEVRIHNDDYTPAEYVVRILEEVFRLGFWKANWVMARAHFTGEALVGVYPRGKAEKLVADAEGRAREDGWPLRFSIEDSNSE